MKDNVKFNALFVDNHLEEYLALRYPNKSFCIVNMVDLDFCREDHKKEHERLKSLVENATSVRHGKDVWVDDVGFEIIAGDQIIFTGSVDDMLDLCNSVPDGLFYAWVIENGKIIHENT